MRVPGIISRTLFHPAWRVATGDRSLRGAAAAQKVIDAPAERILDHQLRRLRAVACEAAACTSRYGRIFREAAIDPAAMTWEQFRTLPVLQKDELRRDRAGLTSRRFSRKNLRESATGGTTASPVRLYMDHAAHERRKSATIAFDRWLGYEPGDGIAYLWGARQDYPAAASLKHRLMESLVHNRLFLPVDAMDEARMDSYFEQLSAFRPVLLQAYPTPLAIFARHLLSRGRRLRVGAVSSCAEPLLPAQREVVEEAFGTRVYDWYGAREAGRIATECSRHEGMHVNAYGLVVEVVESDCGNGLGEIVITDLWNVGMPLLRYAMGDLGSLAHEPCACGCSLPRLTRVVGRSADTFVTASGRRVPGVSFTNRIVTHDRLIRQMQIVQEDYARFRVLVVPGKDFGEDAVRELAAGLDAFTDQQNELRVEIVESIPREASGKVMFCKRSFDPDPDRRAGADG